MVGAQTSALFGRRVLLRPLASSDFPAWRDVRRRNVDWLAKWEPQRIEGQPDVVESRDAFAARCAARARERQLGTGFSFGIFAEGEFRGEVNVSSVQRGPFQNAYLGYWVDREVAGQGYVPESVVVVLRHAFDDLHLHRIQIAIIPRNEASRRVVAKLGIRDEGLAVRYLEIDGVWEDHIRFALTREEWDERREQFEADWLT